MHPVETQNAPRPGGHYSQAMVHGDTVYVAGQLPVDPEHPDADPGDVSEQTRLAMRNVARILEAAGSGLEHLLQVTIYVADVAHWSEVNRVYAEVMGEHRPARAIVPTGDLHHGYLVEIQAVATVAGSVKP